MNTLKYLLLLTSLGVVVGLSTGSANAQAGDLEAVTERCAAGHAASCRQIADRGVPGATTIESARNALETACLRAGYVGHTEGRPAVLQAAERRAGVCNAALVQLLRQSCEAGGQMDCVSLATHVELGIGVGRNARRAREILEPVCRDAGDLVTRGIACVNLGNLVEACRGGPCDPARALGLYESACALVPSSCERLGSLYENGTLGQRDLDAARRAYRRACEAGIPHSCDQQERLAQCRQD